MNLPKIDLIEAVAALLARGEPLTAAQLAASTGKSQSSISIVMKALGNRVHRIGAARNTRYALKKDILGLPAQQAAVWTDTQGQSHFFGELTHLRGKWLHIQHSQREWLVQEKLPWFLLPIRPQGFLGRKLAHSVANLMPGFPTDPEAWTTEQVLFAVAQQSVDCPGAIHFGNRSPSAEEAKPANAMRPADLLAQLEALAQQDASQSPAQSSAGGEQPKFSAVYTGQQTVHHLVKFSPPNNTPFGSRWRAMLMLEHLANEILTSRGIACASTQVFAGDVRTFLSSERFDRHGTHGKSHVVAIAAVHDEFVKDSWTNWITTSEALERQGMITAQELKAIASIFAFGKYIGNTDMHSGNLSFFVDDVITPKIRLAPVYDMLPMMWRPDPHQGLSDSSLREPFMQAGFELEKEQAKRWAIEFWERAAQLNISAELKAASLESARRLKTNFADL